MKYLVLGPGAMGLFAILGHLSTLDLSEIKEISGSSAGSILGFLLCIGMSPKEILDVTLSIDIEKIYRNVNIGSIIKNFGMISSLTVKETLLMCSYGKDPTFSELQKDLYISSFCLNTQKTVYFSKHTHPNMSVIQAVCMSMAIPIIFSSVLYEGYRYIDGATEEKIPINPFLNKSPDDIYAIEVSSCGSDFNTEINNIKDFASSLLSVFLRNRYCYNNLKNKKVLVVSNKDALNFVMTHDQKLELYSRGFS